MVACRDLKSLLTNIIRDFRSLHTTTRAIQKSTDENICLVWCIHCQHAFSLKLIYYDRSSHIYFVNYPIIKPVNGLLFVVVSTLAMCCS